VEAGVLAEGEDSAARTEGIHGQEAQ